MLMLMLMLAAAAAAAAAARLVKKERESEVLASEATLCLDGDFMKDAQCQWMNHNR